MPRRQQLILLLTLLLVTVAALAFALRHGKSRPGNRRVVLKSVSMTLDRKLSEQEGGPVTGWFRITAVIENREPQEVIVDGGALKAGFGDGDWVSDWNPKDPGWHAVHHLRPGESVTLTERLSGHFTSKADSYLWLVLKTDGMEQEFKEEMRMDW